MSSRRSAPAPTARSETAVMLPVASDARASIESVTTTPRKPSSSRSRPSMIGLRLRGDARAVERRIACVPDHHERHSRTYRRFERRQVHGLECGPRAPDRHSGSVGVRRRATEAGEVLRGRGDSACAPSLHRIRHRSADHCGIPGECSLRERRARNARDVRHRRKADRDTDGAQRPRGRRGLGAHGPRSQLLWRGSDRWRPRYATDLASLLVDGNDRSTTLPAKNAGEIAKLIPRRDVAAEQDHAGRAPLAHGLADVLGRHRSGEAEHDELAYLLLERQLIDATTRDIARLKSQDDPESEHCQQDTHRLRVQRRFAA